MNESKKTVYPEQSSVQGEMEFKLDKIHDRIIQFGIIQIGILLVIALALLLGGCSGWGAKRTEYPDGRVVITARQWQCLTDSKRTQMKFAIPDLGIAEVGTSILDAESIAAIGKVIAEIMQPWWLISGKAVGL